MSTQISQREKVLLCIVGGAVFVLLNLFFISYFSKNNASLRQDLSFKQAQITLLNAQVADAPLWQQRNAWLQRQPRLENPEASFIQFSQSIKDLAQKHVLLIDDRKDGQIVRKPEYASMPVKVSLKGSWDHLLDFMYDLQGPEKFVVFESLNMTLDPQNPTEMQATFTVAKWFAPN